MCSQENAGISPQTELSSRPERSVVERSAVSPAPLKNVRRYPHAQIHGYRGLRQSTDRNMIDSGKRIFTNILERDPARSFQWNRKTASAHDTHGLLGLSRTHIIQKQRLRSSSQSLLQLSQSPHLAG